MGEMYPALRYSDGMGGTFNNGVWVVECNSWSKFDSRVRKCNKSNKYMWRGQGCEKPLLPKIYRDNNKPDYEKIKEHLNQFKKNMPGADDLKSFLERAQKQGTRSSEVFNEALSEYYTMIHPKADAKDPKENYREEWSQMLSRRPESYLEGFKE